MLIGDLATHIDLDNSNQAPFTLAHGWANLLGTDPLGRSMLARLIVACHDHPVGGDPRGGDLRGGRLR